MAGIKRNACRVSSKSTNPAKAKLKYYQGFSDPRCAREAQHCKKVVKRLETELKRYM